MSNHQVKYLWDCNNKATKAIKVKSKAWRKAKFNDLCGTSSFLKNFTLTKKPININVPKDAKAKLK